MKIQMASYILYVVGIIITYRLICELDKKSRSNSWLNKINTNECVSERIKMFDSTIQLGVLLTDRLSNITIEKSSSFKVRMQSTLSLSRNDFF